jgi:hypothetical protein
MALFQYFIDISVVLFIDFVITVYHRIAEQCHFFKVTRTTILTEIWSWFVISILDLNCQYFDALSGRWEFKDGQNICI